MRPIAFLLLFFLSFYCRAQTQATGTFRVTHVPNKIALEMPGIRDRLNQEIAGLKASKAVFSVLQNRLKGYTNLPVSLRQQLADGKVNIYTYNIGAPTPTLTGLLEIKATKGDQSPAQLYQDYQVRNFFSGKLVVWDSLAVAIFPTGFTAANDGYFLTVTSSNRKIRIPLGAAEKNSIYLSSILFQKAGLTPADAWYDCRLQNRDLPDDTFNDFKLHFLTADEEAELQDLYTDLKQEGALANDSAIIEPLVAYALLKWGTLYPWNIRQQLILK